MGGGGGGGGRMGLVVRLVFVLTERITFARITYCN